MPGSTTIGHTERLVMLDHRDAEQLTELLARLSALARDPGADRLTDPQLAALSPAGALQRAEFAAFAERLSAHLRSHL